MENKKIPIFNVFSGTIINIPEKDLKLLDISQIPLKSYPKINKKQNYGRLYAGRDKENFIYFAAPCVLKVVDRELSKSLNKDLAETN
jgi:hypothetical protein